MSSIEFGETSIEEHFKDALQNKTLQQEVFSKRSALRADALEGAAFILKQLAAAMKGSGLGAPAEIHDYTLLSHAQALYKGRRKAVSIFDEPSFATGPAWDILLDLLINERLSRDVAICDASIAASCPQTTGLRWITALHEAGLVEKVQDGTDSRRVFVKLSSEGRAQVTLAIEAYIG